MAYSRLKKAKFESRMSKKRNVLELNLHANFESGHKISLKTFFSSKITFEDQIRQNAGKKKIFKFYDHFRSQRRQLRSTLRIRCDNFVSKIET